MLRCLRSHKLEHDRGAGHENDPTVVVGGADRAMGPAGLVATAAAQDATAQPMRLEAGEFAHGDAVQWTAVTLPDTWHLRGLPNKGQGRYRLAFTLPGAPEATWALRVDRVSAPKVVRLNGRVLVDRPMPESLARCPGP